MRVTQGPLRSGQPFARALCAAPLHSSTSNTGCLNPLRQMLPARRTEQALPLALSKSLPRSSRKSWASTHAGATRPSSMVRKRLGLGSPGALTDPACRYGLLWLRLGEQQWVPKGCSSMCFFAVRGHASAVRAARSTVTSAILSARELLGVCARMLNCHVPPSAPPPSLFPSSQAGSRPTTPSAGTWLTCTLPSPP